MSVGTYQLYDYQLDAITSVEKAFTAGKRRVAVVLPTGAGKTVVLSHLIARQPPGTRTLVLAHRAELIDQAAEKIRAICPDLRTGVVRNFEDQHRGDVTVAMVQTISRHNRLARVAPYDLIIIDEAHHSTSTSYQTVLDAWPGAHVVGVTATLARGDGASLGDIFEQVVYRLDILDLIEHDPPYLCDVRGYRVTAAGLDLRAVRSSHGDYQVADLEQSMGAAGAWEAAADAYVQLAADRCGIIFTPTVASAHTVAEMVAARGITCEAVDGDTPKPERDALLARFKAGETQVVANCGVLTEGFDHRAVSCVTIARPTRSAVLYTQMAGRGLRLHEGKTDCLILDLVGASEDHRLATLADLTGHGVAEVSEGESLTEARARHQIQSTSSTPYLGDLTHAEVNLFDASGVIWPEWNGVRYISVTVDRQPATVYIAPNPTRGYDVIARRRADGAETLIAASVSFRAALRTAESWAASYGSQLVKRGSRWRDRPASDKQLALLDQLRIPIPSDCTSGRASELISTRTVARDFTRRPPRGYAATGTEAPSSAPAPRPATP